MKVKKVHCPAERSAASQPISMRCCTPFSRTIRSLN